MADRLAARGRVRRLRERKSDQWGLAPSRTALGGTALRDAERSVKPLRRCVDRALEPLRANLLTKHILPRLVPNAPVELQKACLVCTPLLGAARRCWLNLLLLNS